MRVLERPAARLAVVQHLRAVHGLKLKNWNKNRNKRPAANAVRVFGIALECLPHCHVLDYGNVPCFIVDVCTSLLDHLDTEGLFRKSGSVVRVKSLRGKLERGEDCLATAVPLDISALLKQFFRELPEPILITELHAAFLKVQELPTEEERTSATILLSCVLPDRNLNTLRYFLSFLKRVSQRCAQNRMDSSNLSVIFAPNLFHCGDGTEKMNGSTERRLKHQAAAVQCLIDNAEALGVVPQFLLEKVPAMLGCESGMFSPSCVSLEENNTHHSDIKKSNRRSLGDVVNGALNKFKTSKTPTNTPQSDTAVFSSVTPVIMTPNSKRKLPLESHTHSFSNKKRRSIKKNLGLELFPKPLFGGTSTPGSAHSAGGALDSPQSRFLSSVSRNTRSCRRKGNRLRGGSVSRVDSGKTGCFSPRASKKEPVRKSLRLRFSLSKSSRESNIITLSQPVPTGSEVIGWRLATQESSSAFHVTKETAFSPAVLNESPLKGFKLRSKSKNKLLSPQHDSTQHRSLCNKDTPDVAYTSPTHAFSDTSMNACLKSSCHSEPTLGMISSLPMSLCCTSSKNSFSEERRPNTNTPQRIKQTSCQSTAICVLHTDQPEDNPGTNSEVSSSQLPSEVSHKRMESSAVFEFSKCRTEEQNGTFGQTLCVSLSPLHIDSALFESGAAALVETTCDESLCFENKSKCYLKDASVRSEDCSQLIDALDIQSPVAFRLDTSIRVQSTPYSTRTQTNLNTLPSQQLAASITFTSGPQTQAEKLQNSAGTVQTNRVKVADQVKLFNTMTLNSPRAKVVRSPLKFQRTPVRQSVRRFNSLLADRKDVRTGWCAAGPSASVLNTVSFESGLCTSAERRTPNTDNIHQPSAFSKPKTQKLPTGRALGDITNRALTMKCDTLSANEHAAAEYPKSVCLQVAEKDINSYRGSPKISLREGRLLSATKPMDL